MCFRQAAVVRSQLFEKNKVISGCWCRLFSISKLVTPMWSCLTKLSNWQNQPPSLALFCWNYQISGRPTPDFGLHKLKCCSQLKISPKRRWNSVMWFEFFQPNMPWRYVTLFCDHQRLLIWHPKLNYKNVSPLPNDNHYSSFYTLKTLAIGNHHNFYGICWNFEGSTVADAADDEIFCELFLQKLSLTVCMALAIYKDASLSELADMADNMAEVQSPQADLQKIWKTLQSLPPVREQPSRSQPGVCWYHEWFGVKALKCRKPCKFQQPQGNSTACW